MNNLEKTEFFNQYYCDRIIESSKIMDKHIQKALLEINDNYGLMSLDDCYRALSYSTLAILGSSFDGNPSAKDAKKLNENAVTFVDKAIEAYAGHERGRELLYTLPLIMMDVLAFKAYEYERMESGKDND